MRRLLLALACLAVLLPGAAGADNALSFRASISPRTHLFGDPLLAEVQVVAASAAAARLRLVTDFTPYSVVGRAEVERTAAGGQTEVRWVWRLECLTRACLPGAK